MFKGKHIVGFLVFVFLSTLVFLFFINSCSTVTQPEETTTTTTTTTTSTAAGETTSTTTTTTTSTTTTTQGTFGLSSTAFNNGGSIPNQYAKNGEYMPDIPSAQNLSVPLSWSNVPSGTQSFALTMLDTYFDPPSVHWMVVNIPSSTISLAEGASPSSLPSNSTEIANDYTAGQYEGPWPPQGETHTYRFNVYALNATVESASISNLATFSSAVNAKLQGLATLEGTFGW